MLDQRSDLDFNQDTNPSAAASKPKYVYTDYSNYGHSPTISGTKFPASSFHLLKDLKTLPDLPKPTIIYHHLPKHTINNPDLP
jgi:hypothetical protein